MKNGDSEAKDEMLPEYNFAGKKGIRGKYHQAYRQGHTVRVREMNGTERVYKFPLKPSVSTDEV